MSHPSQMKEYRPQLIALAGFGILLILLMSLRTKPNDLLDREKNRALNLQSTDVGILKQEAAKDLSSDNKARIQILESRLAGASDSLRVEILKELSSVWYSTGEIGISGSYAEEVANLVATPEAWGIAGTTYALCVKRTAKDKERSFCLNKSLEALENAISLDPENLDYQINRAVLLAENPPSENPMQGVQLLLSLNKNFPKNVPVINNIAKFALQTGQVDRAEQRLLRAIELEPNNNTTNCLLAQLYSAKGDDDQSSIYRQKCENR